MTRNRIHHLGAVGLAILAAATILTTAATPASPAVTTKTVTVTVGSRSFPARLSYPTRGGPYPALAFAHGYTGRAAQYASTLDALAQTGIVVIAPDSETGAQANHSRFADDLNRSFAWLTSESRVGATIVPRGKVDGSRTAVAGHSMGGAVALLAAARSRTVDTVATLAALPTPEAAAAVRRLRVPSLFVVASDDRIILASATASLFRRARSPSLLASIRGGSHCGCLDEAPPACDPEGRISYSRQRTLTIEQLRRWLERHLKGTRATPVTGVQGISYTQR
jgi:dienelactone hydrolase